MISKVHVCGGLNIDCEAVKQKRIRQPLKAPPPNLLGTYIADEFALA
jgi:hypothetical protein